jgi:hypothetical protein
LTACIALASAGGVDGSIFTDQRCLPWLSRHSHGDSNVTGGEFAPAMQRNATAAIVTVSGLRSSCSGRPYSASPSVLSATPRTVNASISFKAVGLLHRSSFFNLAGSQCSICFPTGCERPLNRSSAQSQMSLPTRELNPLLRVVSARKAVRGREQGCRAGN